MPKVIDFGIAKATTDQRLTDKTLFTALEQFIGTPAYMSPEQAEMSGLDIDTRCDICDATFAAGGRALVVAIEQGYDHEIGFYDLVQPERAPRRFPGKHLVRSLAVSPDGGLVASSNEGGQVRLFDPAKGERIEDLHGHLYAAFAIAFSPDGRRLISTCGGREAVKLWDTGTRQELLTLASGALELNSARWSADGDVILAGAPWQAWRAPSWEEIATAEAKEKTQK